VLSRARQATRQDLLNARYAREYAESGGHGRRGKGKGKAKQTKAAKGKGAKRATDEDTVRLDDKEVERQVEELMRLDARRFWRLFFWRLEFSKFYHVGRV
jgi:DNA repair exonuclease SbcCD ATPase subunit